MDFRGEMCFLCFVVEIFGGMKNNVYFCRRRAKSNHISDFMLLNCNHVSPWRGAGMVAESQHATEEASQQAVVQGGFRDSSYSSDSPEGGDQLLRALQCVGVAGGAI